MLLLFQSDSRRTNQVFIGDSVCLAADVSYQKGDFLELAVLRLSFLDVTNRSGVVPNVRSDILYD